MLENQSTPAPWHREDDWIVSEAGVCIASIASWLDNHEANARLIIASPNVLEALEDLVDHLWDNRKRDVKKDYSLMVTEVAARNAIAKVKGENNA